MALYDAFSSIFDILSEAKPHPLIELFDEHTKKKREEFKSAHPRHPVTNEHLAQDFSFHIPILPGDASLIENFLADIDIQLCKETGTTTHSLRLLHVGPALFSLIILHVYLSCSHENNWDIFQLVKQN